MGEPFGTQEFGPELANLRYRHHTFLDEPDLDPQVKVVHLVCISAWLLGKLSSRRPLLATTRA